MRLVKVKCTYVIEVGVPDNPNYDVYFDLVENHCPGTGIVGAALDAHMNHCNDLSTCWACALNGKCEIVEEEMTSYTDPDNENEPMWKLVLGGLLMAATLIVLVLLAAALQP